jgi:hypothetical protein
MTYIPPICQQKERERENTTYVYHPCMSTERKKREYMLTSHHDIIEGIIGSSYGLTKREGYKNVIRSSVFSTKNIAFTWIYYKSYLTSTKTNLRINQTNLCSSQGKRVIDTSIRCHIYIYMHLISVFTSICMHWIKQNVSVIRRKPKRCGKITPVLEINTYGYTCSSMRKL